MAEVEKRQIARRFGVCVRVRDRARVARHRSGSRSGTACSWSGEWAEPRSGEFAPSVAPRDEERLRSTYAGGEDVDLAVQAARSAFADGLVGPDPERTGEVPVPDRADPAGTLAGFAVLESLGKGKPIRESHWRLASALRGASSTTRAGRTGLECTLFPNRRPQPVGVGQIIPWNFRCSCCPGRSRPRWPPATRSCSSRPSRLR